MADMASNKPNLNKELASDYNCWQSTVFVNEMHAFTVTEESTLILVDKPRF